MQNLISALPALCFCAALVLGFLEVPQPFGNASLSPYTQWMLSLGLGLPSLWAALSYAAFADRVPQSIGWAPSPFQKEIAGANLGIGLGTRHLGARPTSSLGHDDHGGGILVERRRHACGRYGAAEELRNQQRGSHLLGGTFSHRSHF
jgi:hypothetical protein